MRRSSISAVLDPVGCICDGAGVANGVCSPNGQCICLANYRGQHCDECAPGYYGYPDCASECTGSLCSWVYWLHAMGVLWETRNLSFAGFIVASSHDSGASVHILPHLSRTKHLLARWFIHNRELKHRLHVDIFLLWNHSSKNRQLGITEGRKQEPV